MVVRANEEGKWVFTPVEPLSEGTHVLTATARDERGLVSKPSSPVTITILPPLESPLITWPKDGEALIEGQPRIEGTALPGLKVRVYDGGVPMGAVTADQKGEWALTPMTPLAVGDHALTATAGDESGWISEPSQPVTITILPEKLEPPVITSPREGDPPTDVQQPDIVGTAPPSVKVEVYVEVYDGDKLLGSTEVDEKGNWLFVPTEPLDVGEHVLTAKAYDSKGRVSVLSEAVTFSIYPLMDTTGSS